VFDRVGRILGGKYRLIAPVGSGAGGTVYVADDTVLHRKVAVKILHESLANDSVFLERFRAEARLAAGLNQSNIVAVHDSGEDGGLPYQVTEYLGGGSLRAMLDRVGVLTPSQALLIGLEAAKGLEHAHRRGLIHRDIKPANILFDEEGHVRIADFGLAKALAEASVTEPGVAVLGTARYASPEQAKGERLDGKSDVFSLGLVLLEAITGDLPHDTDTRTGMLAARMSQQIEVPEEAGALSGALQRALVLDPDDRADAGELRLLLLGAAERMPRPGRLDLAPPTELPEPATDPDPTMIAPGRGSTIGRAGAGAAAPGTVPGTGTGAGVSKRAQSKAAKVQAKAEAKATATKARPARAARKRRRWPWVALAMLLVAGAAAGAYFVWDATRTATRPVPELVGSPVDQLGAIVEDFWVVDARDDRADDSTPGEILRTEPEAGVELAEGETLTVYVSLGNALRIVPTGELVGISLEDATAILEGNQLTVGAVTRAFDEEAPQGTVLEVVTIERELPTGSAVALRVSDGPAPRAVPDGLAGLPFAEAEALLSEARLVATRTDVYDASVPEGAVISTDPAAGTELPVDSPITVVVSLGPEPVEIPNVEGQSASDAQTTLEGVGLCVSDTQGPPNNAVIATDPPAGTVVEAGTCIIVITTQFG
jgi:eukaryotic-like serine/threonine-protein kinase